MADIDVGQPVRTELPGDVIVKVADATTPTQQLAIDANGRLRITSMGPVTPGTAAAESDLIGGQFNTTLPTLTTGQQSAVQLDSSGRVLVNIAASAGTLNTKDASDGPVTPGAVAANSSLQGGQFNTALPTLTAGQQAAVQMDSSGRILIGTLAAGTSTIGKVAQDNTVQWITSDLADGSVAAGAAGTKSMLAGLVFNTALPTLTNGQQAAAQADATGRLIISSLVAGTASIGKVAQDNTVQWVTSDLANGPVAAGAAATKSELIGGQFNTALPTLTTGQQAAIQVDSSGRILLGALSAGTASIGKVGIQVAGNDVSVSNPVPVYMSETIGTPVNNYLTSSAIAAGAISNHDYTVTAAKTFRLTSVRGSASGKLKVEIAVETGVSTGVFNSVFVQFSSVSNPNLNIPVEQEIIVAAGVRVRVIRTNKDVAAQDLYSTICGFEV